MSRVKILIAEDHELVRRGLASLLTGAHSDWEICGEAATGSEAIELGRTHQPDVAILDLSLPDIGGLEVAARLREYAPAVRILVLTMHAAAPILQHLRKAGVSAYLLKSEASQKLVESVERILAGEPFFSSEGADRPVASVEAPDFVPAQFLLTPREIDVLRLLAADRSNKQVAADLDMSVRTAETHRANILEKLGVDTLGELVRIAVRDKVI